MGDSNMTEIKEDIKGLRTEVVDLRNIFVSAQKGQSAAANSALSIHKNGHHFACGTLAYSARLKAAIVITNRHAVADSNNHCRYEITVRTGGMVEIPITRWYIPQEHEDIDIAYGRLAHPPPIPALNITSSVDVVLGLQIWAFSLQASGLVALDGRVTSIRNMPYQLITNVGGMPGFSGTGYVDYAGSLSLVHVGGPETKLLRSNEDEATEQDLGLYSSHCLKGMRLGMTGMASHIDACLDLVSDVHAAVETRRRCVEGWTILVAGNLAGQPPDFVSSCASVFANRSIDNNTIGACRLGWRNDCGQDCDFISSCLSFASGKPLDDRAGPATREHCRSGWYDKYAGYALTCQDYMKLRARNPKAEGVAAWVVDDPTVSFIDRSNRFQVLCQ
jgi:hypothetical protein